MTHSMGRADVRASCRAAPALLLAAVAAACGGGHPDGAPEAQAEAAPRVATLGAADVDVAVATTLRSGVPLSGALEPKVNIVVGAPLAEQIVEMFVNEGDPVRQGQRLARFRDDVLRAAAASARADLAMQRLQVSLAASESTRAEALLREGAIAQRDRDNALLAMESARARLALAEAQAASADDRLETSTLKAPVAGMVSRRHAQAGDRVDFGKPVVEIVDTRTLQLVASVEAQALSLLRVGRPVTLVVAQLATDSVAGRISRINPTADPATRQVRIYVDVPNPGNRLVGGLFVSGRVLVREVPDAVAVPRAALRYEGTRRVPTVYLVDGGRVVRREVRVGISDEDRALVEISAGLAAGATVVVGPVEGLADGMPVEIAGRGNPASGLVR